MPPHAGILTRLGNIAGAGLLVAELADSSTSQSYEWGTPFRNHALAGGHLLIRYHLYYQLPTPAIFRCIRRSATGGTIIDTNTFDGSKPWGGWTQEIFLGDRTQDSALKLVLATDSAGTGHIKLDNVTVERLP